MRPEAERLLRKLDAGEVTLDENGTLWHKFFPPAAAEPACEQAGHVYDTAAAAFEQSFATGICILCDDVRCGSPNTVANVRNTRCACGHRGGDHDIAGPCRAVVKQIDGINFDCDCSHYRAADLDKKIRVEDRCDYQTGHNWKHGVMDDGNQYRTCTSCNRFEDDPPEDDIPF